MNTTELAASLQTWFREFRQLTDCTADVPDRLWMFLASRIIEAGPLKGDADVLTIKTVAGPRKVRITGTSGPRLMCEPADGSRGFGMCEVKDVVEEDRGKLSAALEGLLQQGKVREGK